MFIVLLRFSKNKSNAGALMERHNQWLQSGFSDGTFLMAGSIQPGEGGAIIAIGSSKEQIETLVAADPFVEHDVVRAEIIDIAIARCDARLRAVVDGTNRE